MTDGTELTGSQTRLGESTSAPAFDHGRFAPGLILAGRYRIIGLLGRGGMGEVYRADDLTLGQSVALKFLPGHIDADRGSLERLLSEVRTARQVSHPNVCRVHDVGDVGGRRFISMEYIDGEDLSVLLRRIGRLPADKGVDIARQLCAGLAASHERGVLHRDLKPANIMLDGRGRVRITDFGLATALQTDGKGPDDFAGTPAYMAPEQLEGKPVTVQTDIYALGLVLYEIFTGKRFHNVTSLAQLRDRHADATSVDLLSGDAALDPAVARVIERCLESEPRRRPVSSALVAASLPGGDPLAAAIAAGETPSPQLVAAAAVQGALSPRMAVGLGALFCASMVVIAVWQWNPAAVFRFMRPPDVLAAQTRDWLSILGYPEPPVDTAGGHRYRFTDWRDSTITGTQRPWARLAQLRPAAMYFWYREQPSHMGAPEAGRIGLDALSLPVRAVAGVTANEPPFEPGSIYVERAPDGSLDTLHVRPASTLPQTASTAVPVDWSRLFAEARLDIASFTESTPDPALALPGDRRLAWSRVSNDPALSLRVEAAELAGRPVAFRVLSSRSAYELGAAPFRLTMAGTTTRIALMVAVGALALSYLGAGYFMRRNVVLGRGDRRGATRLAKVVGGLVFSASLLSGAPPLDLRIFSALHGAAAIGLFAGAWCWAYYMAIEPFVRRQWPRVLVGWSRLMAGEWRDPQVGREIFIGALAGAGNAALMTGAGWVSLGAGLEPPLHEQYYLRALSSTGELVGGVMQLVPWAMFVTLLWMVLLLLMRRLFRSDAVAVAALAIVFLGLSPTGQPAMLAAVIIGNLAGMVVALRVGFLGLVALLVTSLAAGSLPFAPLSPGVAGAASWIPVGVVTAVAAFGLYTAMAGQSIFGVDGADEGR